MKLEDHATSGLSVEPTKDARNQHLVTASRANPDVVPARVDRNNIEQLELPLPSQPMYGWKALYLPGTERMKPSVTNQRGTGVVHPHRKPRLLDLFCCAGGAGKGYAEAGFEVVGIDIDPQPRYPFEFIQTSALELDPQFIAGFDAIHASPPCQSYSDLAKRNKNAHEWPRLIDPVREILVKSGLPYVIENVEGAPLRDPVMLCGTMFKGLRVLRHRLFEANFPIIAPPHGKHPICHTFDKRKAQFGKTNEMVDFVSVNGGGNCTVVAARDAMGINWMTKNELNEAIPPAYTRLIGKQLLQYVADRTRAVSKVMPIVTSPAETRIETITT